MEEYELSIKETYVRKWSIWETIREIIQNGLDSQDCGHPLTIDHDGTRLSVFNEGAEIYPRDLVLGHGDKSSDRRLRGQHGEGLALALLAGHRAGTKIHVYVNDSIWEPTIQFSEKYEIRVLAIRVTTNPEIVPGVKVQMDISRAVWDEYRVRFLSLRKIPEQLVMKTECGTVLLDDESRGMLYSKGIFVEKRPNFRYGYDLIDVELDRERELFPDFDLKYEIGKIYSLAVASYPEKVGRVVYPLLKNREEDAQIFGMYNISDGLKHEVVEQFRSEHGKDAIAVTNIGESNEAEHFGRKGIVVSDTLKNVLSKEIDTVYSLRSKNRREVIKEYSWNELNKFEKLCLDHAARAIYCVCKRIVGRPELCRELGVSSEWSTFEKFDDIDIDDFESFKNQRVLHNVRIVDFFDKNILGETKNPEGEIRIAKHRLSNIVRALRVLIHEKCHAWSQSSDGTVNQTHMVEEFWSLLFFVYTESIWINGKNSEDD